MQRRCRREPVEPQPAGGQTAWRARSGSTATAAVELWQPRDAELATVRRAGEVAEDVTAGEAGELVPVDQPDDGDDAPAGLRAVLDAKAAERRPIVPGWLRDRAELRYATRWVAGHVGHTVGYHVGAGAEVRRAGRAAGAGRRVAAGRATCRAGPVTPKACRCARVRCTAMTRRCT